jgi:FtsZ-binding cell division protein ZapB
MATRKRDSSRVPPVAAPTRISIAHFNKAIDEIKRLSAENDVLREANSTGKQDLQHVQEMRRRVEAELRYLSQERQAEQRPPARHRTVVREITYEGDPAWIETTLATSLREGQLVLAGTARKRQTITVRTLKDVTVEAYDRKMDDRIAPSYDAHTNTLRVKTDIANEANRAR